MTAPSIATSTLLQPKPRTIATDVRWSTDTANQTFHDHVFTRASARNRRFTHVEFDFSTFDSCYLRLCEFEHCTFVGCRFVATNFHGSTFLGCTFDYATFERTIIDSTILDTCCPALENLKERFARTLRMNFQALGETQAVNKAVLIELDAIRIHLHKAWHSKESYYRAKYLGFSRIEQFFAWFRFKFLDLLWGNGERPMRLARSVVVLFALMAIADTLAYRNSALVGSYVEAFLTAPQIFLGTTTSPFGGLASAGIVFVRLVTFGLFVSMLVRRFARR